MRQIARASLLLTCATALSCGDSGERKIRLASDLSGVQETAPANHVLSVASEEQRTVAMVDFVNATGDPSLDWLTRGLVDMLATELAQSPYFKVLSVARVDLLLNRAGRGAADLVDDAVAAQAASEAGVETFLTGRFRADGGELVIDAELRSVSSGRTVRRETVRGPLNLERVFSMVSELSRRMRSDLRADLEAVRTNGPRVSDMTSSVEAFRYYSRGLDNHDKLLIADADYEFARAVDADPEFAVALLRLAETRRRLGDLEGALTYVERARRHAAKLPPADELRLSLFEADIDNDTGRIRELTTALLELAPQDIEARMVAAQLLFNRRDYERALVEYEAILEAEPTRKLALNQLAYTHAYRGDFDTALKYLRRYQELTPDEPNAFDSMGEVLMMAGRFEQAREQFERALERWPQFENSMANLAKLHAELDDLEPALEYADRWIAAAPSAKLRAHAQELRGLVLWRFDRLDEAAGAFRDARATGGERVAPFWLESEMRREAGDAAAAAALRDDCIAKHRAAVAAGSAEIGDAAALLGFCLTSDNSASELLALADDVECQSPVAGERELVGLYRGLMALRAGDHDLAKSLLSGRDAGVVEKLIGGWNVDRSWVWKYVVEAVELAPEESAGLKERVVRAARRSDKKGHEVLARLLDIQFQGKSGGDPPALAAGFRALGMPEEDDWLVVGPFSNRGGFHRRFPPEVDPRPGRRFAAADGEPVAWRTAADGTVDGFVDLRAIFGRSAWSVGYAQVAVESPDERVVQLRLGADDAVKLWLNDELVWQAYHHKEVGLDHDIVKVVLRPGANRLLVKVTNSLHDWGFYLRVTDDLGDGHPDLRFHPVTDGANAMLAEGSRASD